MLCWLLLKGRYDSVQRTALADITITAALSNVPALLAARLFPEEALHYE